MGVDRASVRDIQVLYIKSYSSTGCMVNEDKDTSESSLDRNGKLT